MKKYLASILAITVLVALVLCGCGKKAVSESEPEDVFVAPKNYASVVQVTINPTVNLYLDEAEVILAVEYVNADARTCYEKVEKELVGKELEKGVSLVVETAAQDGYLDKNKTVTVDIVEAAQEDTKLSIITSATSAIEAVISEKKLDAEVKLTEKAQKVVDDKAAAEKAEADRLAAEKAEADRIAAEKAAAEKAAAEKAAAEKAAADKLAQEKELKNPQKNLKKNVEYSVFKPGETDEMITGIHIKFKDNGEYSYSMAPYINDPYGEGESVVYNGKTYYLAGGGGGGGQYTTTTERVVLTGGLEVELSLTTDGKLKVEKLNSSGERLEVGDIISIR